MFVRPAIAADSLEVRRILDGAMLEPGDVETRIEAGDVLVAGDRRGGSSQEGSAERSNTRERILGALVSEPRAQGAHLAAIGVRRRHRGNGFGRALVECAIEREGRLTARFDAGVRPFYDSLEFDIEPIDERRYRGVLVATGR